jgi:hypothetical protein
MELTMAERKTVIKAVAGRYRRSGKGKKGRILDQVVEDTGYNRSYAGWLLRQMGKRVYLPGGVVVVGEMRERERRSGRGVRYGEEVRVVLKRVWELLDFICGKRLVAALPEVVPRLMECRELRVSAAVGEKLLRISAATADRLLKEERAKYAMRRRGGTKPGTLLKQEVPIRTFSDWDKVEPGFMEMDLVGHDGGTTRGDYCQTLDLTDVVSTWSEQVAVLNRAEVWVFEGLQEVRGRLPFELRGLDSDNGGEFINAHLVRFCRQEGLAFTRSRPYQKNDTCYVEQKNWSVVRRFVGYARYEGEEACGKLNELYGVLRDYVNFFLPSMRLLEKTRDGARVQRRYDRPKTAYQRLLELPTVPEEVKQRLREHYRTLNPAALHRRIRRLQGELAQLAVRRTGTVEVAAAMDNTNGKDRRSPQPLGKPDGRFPQPPPPQYRKYPESFR